MSENQEKRRKIELNSNATDQHTITDANISTTVLGDSIVKPKKRTVKYRFEELKRKPIKNNEEPVVLKSIPQSQVLNTAFSKNRREIDARKVLQPAHKALRRVPSYKSKTEETKDGIKKERETDEMSDHVIWKYSPIYKGTPERSTNSSPDREKEYVPNLSNPPSTPTVSNKLRSVLNFTYLNDSNENIQIPIEITEGMSDIQKSKQNERNSSKDLLRNIDDILTEMREDTDLRLNSERINGLPSSPGTLDRPETLLLENAVVKIEESKNRSTIENIQPQRNDFQESEVTNKTDIPNTMNIDSIPKNKVRSTLKDAVITITQQKISEEGSNSKQPIDNKSIENDDGDLDNDEDDEVLFDIISQQKPNTKYDSKPKPNEPTITESDEMLDDSLLDIFDDLEQNSQVPKEEPVCDKTNTVPQPGYPNGENNKTINEYSERAKCANEKKGVCRLVVLSIREMTLPKIGIQKILTCIDSKGSKVPVILRNPWVYLDIYEGDVIHIIEGKNFANKRLLSQDKDPQTLVENDNLLILHPDLLLSATTIGSSTKCLRCSVIDNMFQDIRNEQSISMTIGNIVHELLQDAFKYKLTHKKLTIDYFTERLNELLDTYSFAILVCNENVDDVKNTIMETHVQKILSFVNKFVTSDNFERYVPIANTKKSQPISLPDIIDIEENIWSPSFGLKGFLDVTVDANTENKHQIVPLEIKTGKYKSQAHEVQGLIYTLLLSDRYDIFTDFFLLMYTWEEGMVKYRRLPDKIRHILMTRNKVASALNYRLSEIKSRGQTIFPVPTVEENPSNCTYCYNKAVSMILFKLVENGDAEGCRIPKEEYEQLTAHLQTDTRKYREFFLKYNDLVTKEESSVCASNQDLFLMTGEARESHNGHCVHNLKVCNITKDEEIEGQYLYQFKRRDTATQKHYSILQSQISLGDRVIVSDEKGHFSITSGNIIELTDDSVTVSTKRKLLNNKISSGRNNESKIESVIDPTIKESDIISTQNEVTYRIDKYDIQQPLSGARFNLLNLFLPPIKKGTFVLNEKTNEQRLLKLSEGGDERMKKFLVDNIAPQFLSKNSKPFLQNYLPGDSTFNEDQHKALNLCLRAEDYALILGMPGTGKTTLIAEIIKILVKNGKKILLTSYTHSAVDNILLKLTDADIKTIRLGSERKIHPETRKYMVDYTLAKSYNEFLSIINETSLVATTCLGINDLLFSYKEKDFDYVILDEASQVSLPVALGPLRFGEKFIMVGDHNQLPPLVKNESARLGGLEDSLFKILSEKHPESMSELTLQYRMCGDIMKLSNFLIYDNKLKCGTEQVGNQSLNIPNLSFISKYKLLVTQRDWLVDIMDPQRRVVFADYDRNSSIIENIEGDNIINEGECKLICQMVDGLILSGVPCNRIGVMTLYRAQLRLLQNSFKDEKYDGLEVLTADQFQGRDKDCILISMVRSNDDLNGGSLLKEVRRVNVAMTRAKSKLIILGSKDTISSISGIKEFISMLHRNGWIYKLPADCLNIYNFEKAF
ncbi:similar to Saccharomyces cerevisiae YHR164C DNA2 Tripartite DNA replication factor with single-stranded DNA-dependent ATPase, ATP-dependent nuclease, and helicase activities [Maudiozyma saulgeensis]|uniref:DNA replication ATP-dependent helicase/nuclease DNA2 n=1 Tax=Maudiozyma saulgeensis TaxID=1789683 RepID=A0A1X7R5A3_9SACH|nr:similar to Saccharomyces cerevisiae YHR164C DNA2 Tripartite DNA replication factor with single-stranded DNA-dependent ATPase, ATP-dependent nuclease, and helicase activities [Kazachstania saulgeensis]